MGDGGKVYVGGEEVGHVIGKIEWGTATAGMSFYEASIFGPVGKTWTVPFGGPMRRYGDIVRSRTGVTLMVIRRVSGFDMRRPDQWECYALDADVDPGNRIGHWKDEELA